MSIDAHPNLPNLSFLSQAAVVSVCDPRVTPDFTSKILRTLATEPSLDAKARSRLVLRYVRIGKPPLESQEDIECYLLALCENTSILDAWLYQRTFSEDPGHNESKGRLIDLIFDYCLYRTWDKLFFSRT